ncbi:unnamed protein product [Brassica oleracea var. botrytis]
MFEWTDLDATTLTSFDLSAKMGASVGRRVAVPSKVGLRRLTVSKFQQERRC